MATTAVTDASFQSDVLESDKPVLVDFWADWCGPCKMIAPALEELSEELGEQSGTGGGADPMAFPCDWHRDLIADFANAIRTGGEPLITGRAALEVHALIDAMVASSRTGAATPVETTQG